MSLSHSRVLFHSPLCPSLPYHVFSLSIFLSGLIVSLSVAAVWLLHYTGMESGDGRQVLWHTRVLCVCDRPACGAHPVLLLCVSPCFSPLSVLRVLLLVSLCLSSSLSPLSRSVSLSPSLSLCLSDTAGRSTSGVRRQREPSTTPCRTPSSCAAPSSHH
jgi:hypothetical protein